MGSKFDPHLFFQRPENVALYIPAAELFGFLKRSVDLPVQWAALVRLSSGDHRFVPAGRAVSADDADNVLFTRVTPVDLTVEEDGLATRDRYHCRAVVNVRFALIPDRSELLSFMKAILGSHRVVQAAGIARYVQPAIRRALASIAAEHDASALVSAATADSIGPKLAEALQAPCFTAGLTLERTPAARFESTTLQQVEQTQQEALRRRAEHDAARQVQLALERAQSKHLDHLATMLARLRDLADDSPDVALPELIRAFSESQRGELYDALFQAEPVTRRTRWIVVAAGDELLFFDPTNSDQPSRRFRVEGAPGPVRSVQSAIRSDGSPLLLLGAATGVYLLPSDRAEPEATLLIPDAPRVRGGFNAVALVGERVLASHSELGLYEWDLREPDRPRPRFESMTRNATAVRCVTFADGHLYCAMDARVIRWPADADDDVPDRIYTGSLTTITALCPVGDDLFAGNGDGDVLCWPDGRDGKPDRVHMGLHRAAESVWVLDAQNVRRLVYSDTSLHVHARVLGDSFLSRYEAGGQTLRRVEVAADVLVATNDLRDRLILWNPGTTSPSVVVSVSRLCGHSVQDVCLVGEA